MSRIFRYEVPVDDQWHDIQLNGDLIAVGCRRAEAVEFWAVHWEPAELVPTLTHSFMVVGTGHELPHGFWKVRGTVVAPGGALVWHLVERRPQS